MAEADGQAVVRLGLARERDPALAGGPAAVAVGAGFARAVVLPHGGQIGLEVTAHINGDRFRAARPAAGNHDTGGDKGRDGHVGSGS